MKRLGMIFASLAVVLFVSASSVPAQELKVASDSSSGTYKKALGELISVCNDEVLTLKEAPGVTGGAVGNLDALFNNQADAAFLHSDVYFANAQAEPAYKALKTLAALWPEPIHVLALKVSKTSKLGTFSYGKQEFNDLADLRGFNVGAAGGGVLTVRIILGQGEAGFQVMPFENGGEVIKALDNGDIAAAIFVGAAPLPNIEKLNKVNYKLLPISETIANRLQLVYRRATINYAGLTTGPVKTLAPLATLLTRKYSTEKKVSAQRKFRECFTRQLGELQDTGSRQWQQVDANDRGVLDWYEIPPPKAETEKKK